MRSRSLPLFAAVVLALALGLSGVSPVPADVHGATAGECACEHDGKGQCAPGPCGPLCLMTCAGGCAPALWALPGLFRIVLASAGERLGSPVPRYSDITLPVPHPPPMS